MDTSKIERNGKIYMLAYDQGLEHGPSQDFNDINVDPNFIMNLAVAGDASCVALQYGIAKRFYTEEFKSKVPLILKLNGKTKLNSDNYLAANIANIEDAVNLGAVGIGFTINPGQTEEHIAFEKFSLLRREAEKAGLITVLWAYARGPEISNPHAKEIVSYAARVGAELGADVLKVKYTGDPESFSWVVKSAAGSKVIASGTDNFGEDYIGDVSKMLTSKAHGIAVGRRIWQDSDAVNLSKRLADVVYNS